MTDREPVHTAQIDRHLIGVFSDIDEAEMALIREVLHEARDRWYGRLVVNVCDSLSSHLNPQLVLPAATAVELLWGYVRLRSRLLVTLTEKHAHSVTMDPTSALLAGDHLYSAAFSSLSSIPDTRSGDCIEILTVTLETITEALTRTYTLDSSAEDDRTGFFEETAGNLGEAATILGATLAEPAEPYQEQFKQFGRSLSTARQIALVLDTEPSEAIVVPSTLDETLLRTHAERRRDDVNQALDVLSESVDVNRLRTFAESTVFAHEQGGESTDDNALD